MSKRVFGTLTMLLLFLLIPTKCSASSPWFTFAPSGPVAAGSAVDASSLLAEYPGQNIATAIDTRGHLRAGNDGHFYFANTGTRARFFGLNFMTNTMFPPFADAPQQPGEYVGVVPADAADQLATRLARMGVNIVRLHFIDGSYGRPVSIWNPHYPHDTLHFDPLQVTRLDYLISRLKAQGIYCDINLHAGRFFHSQDGVVDYNLFAPLSYDKPATQFDPVMIQLQKQYAAELLTHLNPYTGLRLADDPAIAFVEISNEDSVLYSFANDELRTLSNTAQCAQGMACGLPPSYSAQLDRFWNTWLLNRYGTDNALQTAWAPAPVRNQVQSSTFAEGTNAWALRYFNGGLGSVSFDTSTGISAARVDVAEVSGQLWGVQLDQAALSLISGQLYDLTMTFQSTPNKQISVDLIQDQSPYTYYQNVGTFPATSTWQTVQTTFRATITNSGHVQMNLNVGSSPGSVWFSQVTLTPHSVSSLLPNESLSSQSIARQTTGSLSTYTGQRNQDLAQFYYGVQQSFFNGMRDYVRTELGVQAMMTGTAVLGLPLNADLASQTDFVDEHHYFDYPDLTNADSTVSNWVITNAAFTSDPLFRLFNIASLAVKGKPFTVSESGEPFPNDHQSEWLPWLTTFANFQDWDALMPYTYTGWPDNYSAQTPPGWAGNYFFGLSNNVIAAAQFPVASRMFLGSQNTPAAQQMTLSANRTELFEGDPSLVSGLFFGAHGVADWLGLVHSVRTTIGTDSSTRITYAGDAPLVVASDHGELQYDHTDAANPIYRVDSPNLQSVTGFIAGKKIDMSNISIVADSSTALFGSITLQPVDNQPLISSDRLLLSVVTRYQNTGMVWNSARTSTGTNWGTNPSLVEPLAATYTFRLRNGVHFLIYALDAQGNQKKQVGDGTDQFTVTLDTGADQTVWYEIVASPSAPASVLDGASYYLVSKSSGRCLDVAGGPAAVTDGVLLDQWGCWHGQNQTWQARAGTNGSFSFVSASSGKALDVQGGPASTGDGVAVQQWTLWGGTNQLWQLTPQMDGYKLQVVSSMKCLSVAGGIRAISNGAGIVQMSCTGGPDQQWQLIRAEQ